MGHFFSGGLKLDSNMLGVILIVPSLFDPGYCVPILGNVINPTAYRPRYVPKLLGFVCKDFGDASVETQYFFGLGVIDLE